MLIMFSGQSIVFMRRRAMSKWEEVVVRGSEVDFDQTSSRYEAPNKAAQFLERELPLLEQRIGKTAVMDEEQPFVHGRSTCL